MKAGAEILRIPVVTAEGKRTGTIVDLLFDDGWNRVSGLVVDRGLLFRSRRVIGFEEVRMIGPDAVALEPCLPRGRPVREHEADALRPGRSALRGKPVVSPRGRYVGAVTDVLFDENTGKVLGFELANQRRRGARWKRVGLPADLTTIVAGEEVLLSSEQFRSR